MRKVMRYILLVFIFLYSIKATALNPPILSNEATISLLTCSPGDELYSLFGHSALRVTDPKKNIDVVFNYGTFSFNEDFYYNFVMGKLNYSLSVSSMKGFVRSYQSEGRGMIEQILNLDSTSKQALFNYLDWNNQPENREYLYDFFYDNCSSRLRDVLEISIDEDRIAFQDLQEAHNPSFRNIIDEYLIYHPWGDFGIDLGLGMPCDKIPNSYEYMFLPNKLMEAFDAATIDGKPLIKEEKTLLETNGLTYSFSMFDPIPLFWMLFGLIAIISAIGYRKQKLYKAIDVVFFLMIGPVGALVFFLWFITDHTGTINNLNILWAWPTHLLAIPFLFFNKTRKMYWTAYGTVLVLTLLAFPFLPQMLHYAVIPLMLAGIVRAFVNLKVE